MASLNDGLTARQSEHELVVETLAHTHTHTHSL